MQDKNLICKSEVAKIVLKNSKINYQKQSLKLLNQKIPIEILYLQEIYLKVIIL